MTSTDVVLTATAITGPFESGDAASELLSATAGWLLGFRGNTRDAYQRDVTGIAPDGTPAALRTPAWLPWLESHGQNPLTVRVRHVAAYARQLETDRYAPGTIARKLSAISSWYDYMIQDELTDRRNPAKKTARPSIDKDASPATGLSEDEMNALLDQAEADGPRSLALISLLYFGGFRIGSVLGATIGDLGWDQGERILRLVIKGGNVRRPVIEPEAAGALEAYLATRGDPGPGEPLITTATGTRMTKQAAWRLMRRLARQAGILSWAQLNPHSLRHTHATHARDEGVALDVLQETLGHKDPRTTLRYDRARSRRSYRSGQVLSERRAATKAARS
jgi:site-specific recombinase XerD